MCAVDLYYVCNILCFATGCNERIFQRSVWGLKTAFETQASATGKSWISTNGLELGRRNSACGPSINYWVRKQIIYRANSCKPEYFEIKWKLFVLNSCPWHKILKNPKTNWKHEWYKLADRGIE